MQTGWNFYFNDFNLYLHKFVFLISPFCKYINFKGITLNENNYGYQLNVIGPYVTSSNTNHVFGMSTSLCIYVLQRVLYNK